MSSLVPSWLLPAILTAVPAAQADTPVQEAAPPVEELSTDDATELALLLDGVADDATARELGARIARLDRAGERVLDALVSGGLPTPDGAVRQLSVFQHAALLEAVAHLGREDVMPQALARLATASEADAASEASEGATSVADVLPTVLAVLRIHGDERDLPPALDAFDRLARTDLSLDPLDAELRTTLRVMLDRGADVLRPLDDCFRKASTVTRILIVQAVSAAECDGRHEWLVERLRQDRTADLTALSGLGRARGYRVPLVDADIDPIGVYLSDADLQYRREAANAARVVGDARFLRSLIELLEDEEEPVRDAAHRALRSITGLAFGPLPYRWQSWLLSEERWYDERAADLFRRLDDPTAEVVLRTLGTLASHRFERDELAREIAPLLSDERPGIALEACRALGRLGSTVVLEELRLALESADEELVAAAHKTLTSLTGLAIPPAPDAWEVALGGDADATR